MEQQESLQEPTPAQGPKVSLADLDALFVRDMEDPNLDGVARTFAGRLHQITLHMQTLVTIRGKDVKRINHNLGKVFERLQSLEQPPPPAEPAAPSDDGVGTALAAAEDAQPPSVPDKAQRVAQAQAKAAERNAEAQQKRKAAPNGV